MDLPERLLPRVARRGGFVLEVTKKHHGWRLDDFSGSQKKHSDGLRVRQVISEITLLSR